MVIKLKYSFIVMACLMLNSVFGGAYEDILKMNEVYRNKTSLYLEFDVILKYKNFDKSEERHKCVLSQEKNKSYYKALYTEYVSTGNSSVFIDHEQKVMVVGTGISSKEFNQFFKTGSSVFPVDTANMLKLYSFKYSGKNKIMIEPKEKTLSDFSSLEVNLNDDFSLAKINYIYKYKDKPKSAFVTSYEVIYTKQSFTANPKYFDASRFVTVSKNKITANKAYAKYNVVDKRIKNEN
jgi:hypothetical protein